MLTISSDKCIQCNLCSLLCPTEAIENGSIDNSRCLFCGECQKNCPENAITDK